MRWFIPAQDLKEKLKYPINKNSQILEALLTKAFNTKEY